MMTDTNRETIARAITSVIAGAEEKRARGELVGPATEAHIADAYATADRIIAALPGAPEGGEVADAVDVSKLLDELKRETPLGYSEGGTFNKGFNEALRVLRRRLPDHIQEAVLADLSATPAPNTSGLVEIDETRLRDAAWDGVVAMFIKRWPDERPSAPSIREDLESVYDQCGTWGEELFCAEIAIRSYVNGLRTALGGGWRPIAEYDKTPDSIGLTETVILGFAPDETGETLPSTAGYWRQAAWKGCAPCFVSCIDPDTPHEPAQPTHFMPLPLPPQTLEGSD